MSKFNTFTRRQGKKSGKGRHRRSLSVEENDVGSFPGIPFHIVGEAPGDGSPVMRRSTGGSRMESAQLRSHSVDVAPDDSPSKSKLTAKSPQSMTSGATASGLKACTTPFPGIPLHIHHAKAVPGQGGIKKRSSWVSARHSAVMDSKSCVKLKAMFPHLQPGVAVDQGTRKYMEDEHIILPDLIPGKVEDILQESLDTGAIKKESNGVVRHDEDEANDGGETGGEEKEEEENEGDAEEKKGDTAKGEEKDEPEAAEQSDEKPQDKVRVESSPNEVEEEMSGTPPCGSGLRRTSSCPVNGQALQAAADARHLLFDPMQRLSFFAVYDGHAGGEASTYAKAHFHAHVKAKGVMPLLDDADSHLAALFTSFDDEVLKESQTNGDWKAGSCASIVLVLRSVLYTANVGDSSIVLGQYKKKDTDGIAENASSFATVTSGDDELVAVRLSQDHKASEASEKKRITSLGGNVLFGRVFGDLSISRAFGDAPYKKPKVDENFISADPHITKTCLSHEQHFCFIIASDGLWDKVTPEDAVKTVHENFPLSSDDIAQKLLEMAQAKGSKDNVTAMVVKFDWKPISAANDVKNESPEVEKEQSDGTDDTIATAEAGKGDEQSDHSARE